MGSNSYNQELSLKRANVVRDALRALGIAGDTISASGKGETELLVQTGDGVKEPQNRRATINLQ
jgi:outer membrane protein OmpA-like peptidoglycan-associated protein